MSNNKSCSSADLKNLNQLFNKYCDPEEADMIGVDGTELFCRDLEVEPTDVVMLVLAWHLKCERMCEFNRKGWIEGWSKLGCDTISSMKQSLVFMRGELETPTKFKQIYQFAFNFAKQAGQRSLELETAIALWQLIFEGRYMYLYDWIQFLSAYKKSAITKDTWNLFLDFSLSLNPFDNHEDDSAWPVLFDEFVAHMQKHKNT